MSVSYALLGLIEQEPRHGYELKRAYDDYFSHARPLRFGQIYSTLARLERGDRILMDGAEPGRGPERKRYVITPSGRRYLDQWLTEPETPEPYLQSTLFTKIILALLSGRPADAYLDRQRARHLERMGELTEAKAQGTILDAVLADRALFHLEADLRWIDLTQARLAGIERELGRA